MTWLELGIGESQVMKKRRQKKQKGIFKCLIRNSELVGYNNPYKTE